jgi:hypothetical protein
LEKIIGIEKHAGKVRKTPFLTVSSQRIICPIIRPTGTRGSTTKSNRGSALSIITRLRSWPTVCIRVTAPNVTIVQQIEPTQTPPEIIKKTHALKKFFRSGFPNQTYFAIQDIKPNYFKKQQKLVLTFPYLR